METKKKVYLLIRGVDYESHNVIRVCSLKEDAESRLAFLNENQQALRESIGETNDLWKLWEKEYEGYPGDYYAIEEWDIN